MLAQPYRLVHGSVIKRRLQGVETWILSGERALLASVNQWPSPTRDELLILGHGVLPEKGGLQGRPSLSVDEKLHATSGALYE
jgi:hypothetical protein